MSVCPCHWWNGRLWGCVATYVGYFKLKDHLGVWSYTLYIQIKGAALFKLELDDSNYL